MGDAADDAYEAAMYESDEPPIEGDEEGDVCHRDGCEGVLILEADASREGCSCHLSPPCGYCMSKVPTCPTCGWRADEP